MPEDAASATRVLTILDGATGTTLASRGASTGPPLFSAAALIDAPQQVVALHRDYVSAGAEVVLSTNSFFTHARNLRAGGLEARARELTMRSVELARRARDELAHADPRFAHVRIAGAVSPLVGNAFVADPRAALAEHRQTLAALVDAGCDLLLLESMTSLDALEPALAAARELDRELWVSLVPGAAPTQHDPARLLGGGDFEAVAAAALDAGASALLLNCCALDEVDDALDALERATSGSPGIALGLYPHLSAIDANGRWVARAHTSETFAARMDEWAHEHPRLGILGACCGSTPEDIAALTSRVRRWSPRP